ncbi:MAG: hypothetical protein HZB25_05290 [Candidatus Eisenbacteria bacterium]|nr:hypothetical protein [Candidatus Eisenbacteria bacterium]
MTPRRPGSRGAAQGPGPGRGAVPGGGPRALTRREIETGSGPVPRVSLLCGGDAVLAAELAEALAARVVTPGMESFNRETLHAAEVKLRDLVTRAMELPVLSAERCMVVKGAEALLKQGAEALAHLWPPPDSGTALILLAAQEDAAPGAGRKGAARWTDVLPAHAARLDVGAPTADDAIRWGRRAAAGAGSTVDDEVFRAAHKRCRGDGARLRTALEQAVLGALCGQAPDPAGAARRPTIEEAEAALEAALASGDWRAVWPAAERFRALGGRMDSSGAALVRRVAERAGAGGPAAVDALRALSALQLRWRREIGSARKVLEWNGVEMAMTRLRREEG